MGLCDDPHSPHTVACAPSHPRALPTHTRTALAAQAAKRGSRRTGPLSGCVGCATACCGLWLYARAPNWCPPALECSHRACADVRRCAPTCAAGPGGTRFRCSAGPGQDRATNAPTHIHIHMCTRTRTHAHIHAASTHIRACTRTHTHARTHSHKHRQAYTSYTHIHMRTLSRDQANVATSLGALIALYGFNHYVPGVVGSIPGGASLWDT